MFVTGASDKLKLQRSSAAAIDVLVSWSLAVASGLTTPTMDTTGNAFSSAATGDIMAAAGAGNTRKAKRISIRNKDASLACDVTPILTLGGVDYEIGRWTLQAGEMLQYEEGLGWFKHSNTGYLDVLKIMGADSVHATAATFADITGLTQALLAGKKYRIEADLFHTNDASTTGSQFAFNYSAGITAALFGEIGVVTNSPTAAALDSGTATAVNTAFAARTTGQTATGVTKVAGFIQPSADGTFALRATSEVTVANGLVVKTGSSMRIVQEH